MAQTIANPTSEGQRLSRAVTTLVFGQPFWATLALRLQRVPSLQYPTLAVDGRTLWYNPQYTATLDDSQLMGALAECIAHCALGHPWRGAGLSDPEVWNSACDHAVRPLLEDSNFNIPAYLRRPDLVGKSAEQIYNILILEPKDPQNQQSQQPGQQPGQGSGQGQGNGQGSGQGSGSGQGQQNPQGSGGQQTGHGQVVAPQDPGNLPAQWTLAVEQAYVYSKGQGLLPNGAEKLVGDMKRSSTNWRAELRRFLQAITRTDYSWSKPNPRYQGLGLYMPDLYADDVGELVIAIDTSGSTARLVTAFISEISEILEEVKPSRVHVLQCDAKVWEARTYERGEALEIEKVRGGGGTDFRPVFEWIEENLETPPVGLLYFTDLWGTFPDEAPEYGVLWADPTDLEREAPFGEILHIQAEEVLEVAI